MPLLDHFHPPIVTRRPWESFHSLWCAAILDQLNELLPPRYFGAVQVHLGTQVEADVAEFDQGSDLEPPTNGKVAVTTWAPPAATHTMSAVFPDDIEVRIFDTRDGAVLVAVVELVSPRNKDRPEARDAFAAKCAAYLQCGIGLLVIDIVTNRHANLHNAVANLLHWPAGVVLPAETFLYAAAYHPVRRGGQNLIDNWLAPLSVGQRLPVMPLPIRGMGCLPLDLEVGYSRASQSSRL
jgi:Protein of unknown function (DUF4058)